ncbi:ubiquitin carboxyl-terminal hydrolase 8 [Vigna radiata var. radiata]|uniref:Ubiquitin carboxyl-terminal hydrolase n=1 Tax=Vigna radiata var. radiata TaxID=3916 RepID=A0A1S3TQX1_VIGRR|nr:ubiquitin carboxyl-terminal hydrolase 8 [Vigna radiata var. radiata]
MTRFSERLRLRWLFPKPTRFLALVSLSTLHHLCKSLVGFLLSQTLPFLAMDNFFSDYLPDDFDSSPYRPHRRFLLDHDLDLARERVYLLPHRWLVELEGEADRREGVLYTVTCNSDSDSEISLHLRKEEERHKIGVSGRQYALVPEGVWLRTLKRYNDSNSEVKDLGSLSNAEDCLPELFPLQVKIFFSLETSSLEAKISLKENVADFYEKACDIFNSAYNPVHIWDFSGQTTQFFLNGKSGLPHDSSGQSVKEVTLELQVHGLPDSMRGNGGNEMILDRSQMECSHSGSVTMNGSTDYVPPCITANYFRGSSCRAIQSLGLTGLQNLGNTCFMNSAIQCLAHTPKLVDFFLGDYHKEINYENPLGMNGELALAFGDLLRKLWVPRAMPIAPRMFKMKLANFAPQFSGYSQHDSQELLAFLLDGLHEDLNRVKRKPYHEVKDADGRPDEEVAEEYWRNHLARNDSIVVDLCQGQFRSTLVCPICKKVSITFDPFMYLSLPLPSTTIRTMTLTVISTDGITLPSTLTVTVPKCGTLKDLIGALSTSCSLREDETLLVAEIYKNKIFRVFENPSESLGEIRDQDKVVAYRMQKDTETTPLVAFVHERSVETFEKERLFGIPLVTRLSNISCGYDVQREFLKIINPFMMRAKDVSDDCENNEGINKRPSEDDELGDTTNSCAIGNDTDSIIGTDDGIPLSTDFEFYLHGMENGKIILDKPLTVTTFPRKEPPVVVVQWSDKMLKMYNTSLLDSLPEVFKSQQFTKRIQESVSIYKCLEAFLKEEPLGPEDMWYCPNCKKPQQATKKLDLWRLPEILVVHLKRFSYSRYLKNKLETFVDFPINNLDLSTYVAYGNSQSTNRYVLYAISCHYGGLGGGHYTAFVRYGNDKWYDFDDSRVEPVNEDTIKTPAAYVLFYRKV